MPLRLRSLSVSSDEAPSLSFNWENVDHPLTPESISENAPSPPAALLPFEDMHIYGATPLRQPLSGVIRCPDCDKPLLASALAAHAANCAEIRAGNVKSKDGASTDSTTASKKRKAEAEDAGEPKKKKSKKEAAKSGKGARIKGPLNLDKHCGVINKNGMPCARNITCKVHGMNAKRAVLGRTKSYDVLFVEHKRATDPNYVEPVKRETKAEKKAKKDKERELKKAEKEAVAAKKRKNPGAPNQSGSGAGTSGAGVSGAGGGAGAHARGASTDYESGLDTDVELEVMVRSVRASKPTPLADRDNVGNWFIGRNEWLRSTRDLLGDALGGGATGFSARRIG